MRNEPIAGDRGSIPVALLVTIIVGGLATVLVAGVLTGQRSTRFDRDFTQVVQVADAGVQDALTRLNAGLLSDGQTETVTNIDGNPAAEYTFTATVGGSPQEWVISSQGTLRGVTRTVEVTSAEVPLFQFALFARTSMEFNGANYADSYNPSSSTWCTGNGIVGSDGFFEFSGLAPNDSCHKDHPDPTVVENPKVTVDGAHLYECGALDATACRDVTIGANDRCSHSGGENCLTSAETNRGPLEAFEESWKLTPTEELQTIADDEAVCEADGYDDTHPARPPSDPTGGVNASAGGNWVTQLGDIIETTPTALGRDFWCVQSILFEGDTGVERGAGGEGVRIYVHPDGFLKAKGTGRTINCPAFDCDYRVNYPDASALKIIAREIATIDLKSPQIQFAGAVYAPQAVCKGGVGGIDVYGSLVCGYVDNVGNWAFHYDDSLADQGGTETYAIDRYREES